MKTLSPVFESETLISEYAKEISKSLKAFYLEVLDQENEINNSGNALELALIRGKIFYKDGSFRGEFNGTTSKMLRDLGAQWKNGAWRLPMDRISPNYLSAIAQGQSLNTRQVERLLNNLMKIDVARIATKADVSRMVDRTIDNINMKLDQKRGIVPLVKLQLDEQQLDSVKKSYTENANLHIKGWTQDRVDFLRKKVNEDYRKGVRYETIARDIEREFKVSPQKALFIARQETHLINAAVKEQKFTKAGFMRYVWKVRKDDKVRHDHEILDGKEFRFDDPPITDSRTGKRGNPGTDYNCRCYALPIVE